MTSQVKKERVGVGVNEHTLCTSLEVSNIGAGSTKSGLHNRLHWAASKLVSNILYIDKDNALLHLLLAVYSRLINCTHTDGSHGPLGGRGGLNCLSSDGFCKIPFLYLNLP